jgi:hypothetical protein
MRKFISKICKLSLLTLSFVLVIIISFRYKISRLKFDESVQVLVLGDSHTQSGVDDSKIKNCLNISQSSEHFLYTYNVLNILLGNNPHVRKVIVGVSFHSFGKSYDKCVTDNSYTRIMFPRYYPVLDVESILDIEKIPFLEFRDILKSMIFDLFNHSGISEISFIGKYYRSNKSNLNDYTVNSAVDRHYFIDKNDKNCFSDLQVKYLSRIVDLCKLRNVELIFINTPVHMDYFEKIPGSFLSNYYSTINRYRRDIRFFDFHSIYVPNNEFGDGDHLNYFGATKLSKLISERLDNKN